MTSKERMQTTFAHKDPDKVAVDFGGFPCSRINAAVLAQLRDYYGLEKRLPRIDDMSTMTAYVDPDLGDCLGTDVSILDYYGDTYGHLETDWKEWNYRGVDILIPKTCTIREDGSGGYYVFPQGDDSCAPSGHMPANGFYFDNLTRTPEFDEDEANADDNVEDYGLVSDEQVAFHKEAIKRLLPLGRAIDAAPFYVALGDANNIPGPNLKNPKGIRSIAEWYTAPLEYPDYVEEVFEKGTDRAIQNFQRYWDEFGSDIDFMFICGADFGTQRGPFLSNAVFEEFYVPYYQKMNNWIHEHTTWKTLKHCCGGIYPLIPLLIEAGFDGLNPVQCSAEGMEPQRLKDEFGKDIVFWGGGVDTQKVLPFGTPQEVHDQVLERLKIFSKGGGYVFNTIHNIQAGTPIENIIAMIDAVKEFNGER